MHILNLASMVFQAAIATTAPTRTTSITSGEASRRSSLSSGQQPPHLPWCIADWGSSQLLPAAGTIAHTTEGCTKRSHCNRFDACMTRAQAQVAPKSAQVWARTLVLGAQAMVRELLPP